MHLSKDKKYRLAGFTSSTARVICDDLRGSFGNKFVVAYRYYRNGIGDEGVLVCDEDGQQSNKAYDLVEVGEWDDFKYGDPVMVGSTGQREKRGHFSHVENGMPYCFNNGWSPFTAEFDSSINTSSWTSCRRPTSEELVDK